jgi:cell division protein FtsA
MLQCVEGAAVVADEVVLSSIASGDAVLGETERDMGVVVADIGGGTTDIAIFIDGAVWHTVTLGVGGEYVTNDIAVGLRLPPQVAEQVKLKHGHARASAVSPDERFEVRLPGDGGRQALPRWKLAEIIEARIEELLLMIQQEIKRSGYDGLLPGGVILCGGTAQLPGLTDVAGELFVLPVRVGQPMEFSGLVDTISNPAHATGVGLMSWGMTVDSRPQWHEPEPKPGKRFANWLRAFLPG